MEANPYALKQILTLERRYVIPSFQRDYEWTREGQWELLFDDLESVAGRLADARLHAQAFGGDTSHADKRVAPHFLGAIVLDQLLAPAGGLDLREVIDGQQRLTTLQLLLRGLLDMLLEINSPRIPQVRRLLENPGDVVMNDYECHKLWPRRRDRSAWQAVMADTGGENHHVYGEARRYFRDRARATISEGSDAGSEASLLVDAVLDLFKIVVIDLEDNDDAQVIFEVLNGRQTPLTAADLVKNLLFLRAETDNDGDLDRLYEKYWAGFDDPWWKTEVGRGHAARRHTDMLLAAWLTIVSEEEVSAGRLYGQIRRYIDSGNAKVSEVLEEISSCAAEYRVVRGAEHEPDERLRMAYESLNLLGVTTALPLLLWLRSLPVERVSPDDHRRAVAAVESFVVRRFLIGAQTRGYGPAFAEVLSAAKKRCVDVDENVADVIEHALAASPSLRWPTDVELVDAFLARSLYGVVSQARIRMVLGAMDAHLQCADPKGEQAQFNYNILTIEHVMPQAWGEHWPVSGDGQAELQLAVQRRDRAVNRIGNLTLVTNALNPALSNERWPSKRPELAKHSVLRLNAGIIEKETWDEEAIDSRAQQLADIAAQIWPPPPPDPE